MIKKVLNKRNSGRYEWKHQKKVTRTPNNLYPSRREVGATYLENHSTFAIMNIHLPLYQTSFATIITFFNSSVIS